MFNPMEKPPVQEAPMPEPAEEAVEQSSDMELQSKLDALSQMVADLQATLGKKMSPPVEEAQEIVGV